jgi:uncharacterized protein (TIGR02678 family)
MILADLPDVLLGDLQQAARALLRHGLLTSGHGRDLVLVRRFASELDQAFSALCGYRVVLRGTGARLVRIRDHLDPTPALHTRSGRPCRRDHLALLLLALAELDRFPHQVALSELASALRRAALELGIDRFDPDQHAHRRAFCDVLDTLQDLGVLLLTDGGIAAWEQDPDEGEALFDVDHDAALLLFRPAVVVERIQSVDELLTRAAPVSRDPRRQALRQRVARALVEAPVVLFDDLDDDARQYLVQEWRGLAADLERLLGCPVERRKEGAALVDTAPGGLGERFPQGGSAGHAALLLAERMVRRVDPEHTASAPSPAAHGARLRAELDRALDLPGVGATPAEESAGPLLTTAWLEQAAAELVDEYGAGLKADFRADPLAMLAEALALLEHFGLVRPVAGGVVAMPALARYRRPELTTPSGPQVGLFGSTEDPA